ncbi:MAG: hypothetical protein QOI10_179 [Solirubrobacterales bacterium]|jgi:hypothetical protein|nr:hypothetical protein [Solirubrobacterales bacterium]
MSEPLQFGLGVALSLLLFAISYRQTIGARKERARSANTDMERVLRKRLLLEGSTPSVTGLSRFIEGTARTYRVRVGDLFAEEDLLSVLFARVLDDDLLSADKRSGALAAIEKLVGEVERADEEPARMPSEGVRIRWVAVMGVTTAFAGSLAAIAPLAGDSSDGSRSVFFATLAASVALIATVATVLRFRDRLETGASDFSSPLQEAARLEQDVRKTIEAAQPALLEALPSGPVDFVVQMNGGPRIGIEVKMWRSTMPKGVLARSLKGIGERGRQAEVDRVWVVTPRTDHLPLAEYQDGYVRVVSLSELGSQLKNRSMHTDDRLDSGGAT